MEALETSPSWAEITDVMHDKGYTVFDDALGDAINLVGIRSAPIDAERFSDWIVAAYRDESRWNCFAFPATTDPATFYRLHPDAVRGRAVLKPGQYPGLWSLSRYRGARALRQAAPATVHADARREHFLDTEGMTERSGHFGLYLHRAGRPDERRRWRAGCQVVADSLHCSFLMDLCARASARFGDRFTYTLLEEADFVL